MATFVMASVLRARVLRSAAVAPQASKAAVAATPAPAGTPHEGALTIEQINDPVRRTGVIAVKKGMMAMWDQWGVRHPLTVLQLEDVQVVQVKTAAKEGYDAVQVGATNKRADKVTHPLRMHFAKHKVKAKRVLMEFRVTPNALLPTGTWLNAAHFTPGQYVDACATSIGKGFQGPMKRWNFGGLPASHGVSVSHRSHGATGQRQDPGRVFKGKKMAGHLGNERCTVQSLQVFKVDTLLNLVFVRGSVPGHDGAYVRLTDALKKPLPSKGFFPTYLRDVHPKVPREIVMPGPSFDPLTLKPQ